MVSLVARAIFFMSQKQLPVRLSEGCMVLLFDFYFLFFISSSFYVVVLVSFLFLFFVFVSIK